MDHASAGMVATAGATSTTLDGVVAAAQSRWSAGRIVTDSVVRADDGRDVVVTQMGGTVDGIGMVQIPAPPILATGDRVSLRVQAPKAGKARALEVLEVRALERGKSLPPAPFVRTTNDFNAPLYWSSGCVFITYDAAGTNQLLGDEEFTVLDAMFARWRESTQACSYLTFELTAREVIEVGFDRKNVIKFRDERWCRPATPEEAERCYAPDAAALTTLHFVNDAESGRNGEILDADIELNGEYFAISNNGISLGTATCRADLGNTMTHEVGHLMGLDHTCRAPAEPQRLDHKGDPVPSCALGDELPAEIREASMYNYQDCGETVKSTPAADDIAGVCAIYALEQDPDECKVPSLKSGGGWCSAAGTADGSTALAWLIMIAGLVLVRRRRR